MLPMCMYSAPGSVPPHGFSLSPLRGPCASAGAGLIIVEATGVVPEGRISDNCLGLWSDDQIGPLSRLVAHVHSLGQIGIQLNHAGRKCGAAAEKIFAPSAINYSKDGKYQDPVEMTHDEITFVTESFASAAGRALKAGSTWWEIHRGSRVSYKPVLSPLSNQRHDGYGVNFEGRSRFLQLPASGATAWLSEKPLFLRVSAEDYAEGGMTPSQMARIIDRVIHATLTWSTGCLGG